MSKTLKAVGLADVAPDSITKDVKVSASIKAIDPHLNLSDEMDYPAIYTRIDSMTSQQLDHLAMQYDATWRESWPISRKRAVIKMVISQKRKVGTMSAVMDALSAVSSIATVTEWWQSSPAGTPHTFTINVTVAGGDDVSSETQEDLMALIDNAKPLRSWYDIVIQQKVAGTINICGIARTQVFTRISHLS